MVSESKNSESECTYDRTEYFLRLKKKKTDIKRNSFCILHEIRIPN